MSITNGRVGVGTADPSEKLEVTGNVLANQFKFNSEYYNFSLAPRTQLQSMSIKLFDDYYTYRPGGTSPDNNAYGTLLAVYGRSNHWESNIYFGASTKKMYFRTSTWSGGNSEIGTTGSFHNWRTILDSKSDVESSKLLKLSGSGNHYISNGNVGIGTTTPDYKLDVIGTIRAQEIMVNMDGADFVFEDDYKLRTLEEVESFVKENKHLPEIAPAKEMQENGAGLSELNTKLLQKIEELTLYTIQQQKEIIELKDRLDKIETKK
ncbi:MAG: hypothetical protein GY756_01355 [bacterium]|nr:hypothetical protein [bacterium]